MGQSLLLCCAWGKQLLHWGWKLQKSGWASDWHRVDCARGRGCGPGWKTLQTLPLNQLAVQQDILAILLQNLRQNKIGFIFLPHFCKRFAVTRRNSLCLYYQLDTEKKI